MASLRAVFWDVDGTLADTEMDGHRPAFNAAFAELKLPFLWDEDLYAQLLAIPGGLRRVQHYAGTQGMDLNERQLREIRDRKRVHYRQRPWTEPSGSDPAFTACWLSCMITALTNGSSPRAVGPRWMRCLAVSRA